MINIFPYLKNSCDFIRFSSHSYIITGYGNSVVGSVMVQTLL